MNNDKTNNVNDKTNNDNDKLIMIMIKLIIILIMIMIKLIRKLLFQNSDSDDRFFAGFFPFVILLLYCAKDPVFFKFEINLHCFTYLLLAWAIQKLIIHRFGLFLYPIVQEISQTNKNQYIPHFTV